MLTRNKKLKDYGIPAEDIEKLNTMLKGFPVEYGYLLSSAALSACPKNTVIADMVIENILHRKSYRKISKERYIPMNPKDFYGYRRKTVAVLYERMRLLGVWEDEKMRLIDADKIIDSLGNSDMDFAIGAVIDNQPTAFDVEKVTDEILRASCIARPMGWNRKREIIETHTAIEIVKGGGVE